MKKAIFLFQIISVFVLSPVIGQSYHDLVKLKGYDLPVYISLGHETFGHTTAQLTEGAIKYRVDKVAGFTPKITILILVGDTVRQVLASSYLNFFITEEKVLIPSYIAIGGDMEKEKRDNEIFSEIFPQKKLVYINSAHVNSEGGGIHCITPQVPKRIWFD